jgi:hypothetical protein
LGRSAKENKQTIHLGIFDTRIMFPVMFYTKSHGIKTLNVLTINCKSFNYNNLIKFIYIREKRQATRSDAFLKSFKCEGLNLSYNIYIYVYQILQLMPHREHNMIPVERQNFYYSVGKCWLFVGSIVLRT